MNSIDDETILQCARCGSSADWMLCDDCDFTGYEEYDDGDGIVPDMHSRPCFTCGGEGGWARCLSDAKWCEDHPIPGREATPRGRIEEVRI